MNALRIECKLVIVCVRDFSLSFRVELDDLLTWTAKDFCPPIYPLGDQEWQVFVGVPLLCLHSLQIKPSPAPPWFASQTVINCQPLMVCINYFFDWIFISFMHFK